MFSEDKKKVEKLHLAWQRNTGGIRDRDEKYRTINQQQQGNSINENEEDPNDPLDKKHTQLKTVLRNCVHNTKDNDTSNNWGIDDFFGCVVGQAVITVDSEICSGNYQEHTASITKGQTTESSKLAENEEVTQFRKANYIVPDQTSQTTKQHNVQWRTVLCNLFTALTQKGLTIL